MKKAFQYFAWFEFADLTNFHLYAKLSKPLDWNPLTFRILSPLGLLGFFLALREFKRNALPCLLFFAILGSAVLFYISGRYRLAVMPLMFAFAGHALDSLLGAIHGIRKGRGALLRLAGLAASATALFVAVNLYDPSKLHSMWHGDATFGNHNLSRGRKALLEGDYEFAEQCGRRML
ncbi:MAG: hypothetical protein IID38_09755, partial [Planctomycetes bacterium]|nr:hypothetical protein [Planctomycetota bacterium]